VIRAIEIPGNDDIRDLVPGRGIDQQRAED
jgi:hypothetical protein